MLTRSNIDPPQEEDAEGICLIAAMDKSRVLRGRSALVDEAILEDVLDIFKVLSQPTRVHLLTAISTGELCVCDLAEVVGLSVSAISHQLRDLRRLKLVQYRMDGRQAYYSIRDPFVLELLDHAVSHYADGSDQ